MEKQELIESIILEALFDGYRTQAQYQGIDADELIAENKPGAELFAESLASKIYEVMSN